MSSESTETPRLVPVMDGSACAGFLISLGPRGVEAFDKDEKSLGVFPDAPSAATALKRTVVPALPGSASAWRAATSSPKPCARRSRSKCAPKRARSKFQKNSSFRTAPASRWCGVRTRTPRCPDGSSWRAHFPWRSKPFEEEGNDGW